LGTLQVYRALSLTAIRGGTILRYSDYDSKGQPWVYLHPLVIIALALIFIAVVLFFGWSAVRGYLRNVQNGEGISRFSAFIGLALMGIVVLVLVGGAAYLAINQLQDTTNLVKVSFFEILNGRFIPGTDANFRTVIIWWLFTILVFTVILGQTRYGSATYATGGNAGAARAQGIAVDRVRIINFVVSGALAGLAGVIAVGRQQSVNPTDGMGLELEVIAAAVIGGTLLSGGFGSIIGATLGVLIEGILQNGLVFLRVPSESFTGYVGAILIVTVIINTAIRRAR
jgi:simple sugar transport system permease protein